MTAGVIGRRLLRRQRLLKLADGLERLQDNEFDIVQLVSRWERTANNAECGTVCCAIGWCPRFFPEHWHWDKVDSRTGGMPKDEGWTLVPALINPPSPLGGYSWIADAGFFFDLSNDEVLYMFSATRYHIDGEIQRADVIARIRQFAAELNRL